MMQGLRVNHVLVALFLWASFTAAWPWPPSLGKVEGLILRRQGKPQSTPTDSTSSSSATNTNSQSATITSQSSGNSKSTSSSTQDTSKGEGSSQATKASKTDSSTGSSTNSKQAAQTTPIDPRLPAGGINMVTPSALARTTYYKIGDNVQFAWNYTSLSVTPTAIDVFVSCSANSATYTLSNNATFQPTGNVIWDTHADATGSAPLLSETYTLVIHDAAKDVTAVPSAGHLGTYNQFTFGMYLPQPYTPLADWVCATCSGALSDMERQTLKFMFGMCMVTILSFTWFVGGFGGLL